MSCIIPKKGSPHRWSQSPADRKSLTEDKRFWLTACPRPTWKPNAVRKGFFPEINPETLKSGHVFVPNLITMAYVLLNIEHQPLARFIHVGPSACHTLASLDEAFPQMKCPLFLVCPHWGLHWNLHIFSSTCIFLCSRVGFPFYFFLHFENRIFILSPKTWHWVLG